VVKILTVEPTKDNKFGTLGGLEWVGDEDNEYIFGTSWLDVLKGEAGNDVLYGLEGADKIYGGKGNDRIFGDAGDDTIYTS
jgi:Ca2+-binding RTX toxin-like protein